MATVNGDDFGFDYMPAPKRQLNWVKGISYILCCGLLLLFVMFTLVFGRTAELDAAPVPTAADVQRAKDIYRRVIRFASPNAPGNTFEVTGTELNSLFVVGSHARPDMRAEALAGHDQLTIIGSVRLPFVPFLQWINGRATLHSSAHGLSVSGLRIGSIPVPPPLAIWAVRKIIGRALNEDVGTEILKSVGDVKIGDDSLKVEIGMPSARRSQIAKRAKMAARDFGDVSSTEQVKHYVLALDAAVTDGTIKPADSIAPFLSFILRRVSERMSAGANDNEAQAALLALSVYCGHNRFEDVVGDAMPAAIQNRSGACYTAQLSGRTDLKLHFVVSAGLHTLSDSGVAFAVGEIKELLDSNSGGSGFSFDDIAADRAGIRFAMQVLEASPDELAALAEKIQSEKDIFPSIQSLPSGMAKEDFERIYKDVESVAYKQLIDEIDTRLDGVAFFKR